MLQDALLYASRLGSPWRQLFYAGLCLVVPPMLLLYALGSVYVGVAACGIALVIGILGAPFWLVKLLRLLVRTIGGMAAPRPAS